MNAANTIAAQSAPDSDALHQQIEEAWSKMVRATRLMHFLMCDLEHGLDPNRGRDDGVCIRLGFQADSLDATKWLAGEAWTAAREAEALALKAMETLE